MDEEKYDVHDAIRDLRAAGLDVESRAYGFHLSHHDLAGAYEGECGSEHDWSIALSLRVHDAPVRWFFRYSLREMALFLMASYVQVCNGETVSLIDALEHADRDCDQQELEQRLRSLRKAQGFE